MSMARKVFLMDMLVFAFWVFGCVFSVVAAPGDITTVAGGDVGDGRQATEAWLNYPGGVFMDSRGNLFIADTGNYRIRRVEGIAAPTILGGITPRGEPWDVNRDDKVDIFDLALVARAFRTSGKGLPADVNGDGVVNILDLVMVAVHFGEKTNPHLPAAPPVLSSLHVKKPDLSSEVIEGWLAEARAVDDGSEIFQRGIAVLEHLLNEIVPEKTTLLQNYPNPFNPETWIPYQLSEASEVTLTIYDALGRPIKRIDLGYQPAGTYRTQARAAHWDGRNEIGESVASGAYFVELKTKEYRHVRRIALLK